MKEPLLSLLLSFVVPGAGHVYAGEIKKGISLFLSVAILAAGTVAYVAAPETKVSGFCVFPAALCLGLVLFCLYDSYRAATRRNVSRGLARAITPAKKRVFIEAIVAVLLLYCCIVPPAAEFIGDAVCRVYAAGPDAMEPVIYKGDLLLVDMAAYAKAGPRRGDVVIYRFPQDPGEIFLHRVVGLPGESVVLKDHDILINGKKLTDGWALNVWHYNGGKLARRGMKPIRIPQDAYFVLGDSAARSRDSRYWGPLPKKFLLGRAYKICYPFGRSGAIY